MNWGSIVAEKESESKYRGSFDVLSCVRAIELISFCSTNRVFYDAYLPSQDRYTFMFINELNDGHCRCFEGRLHTNT